MTKRQLNNTSILELAPGHIAVDSDEETVSLDPDSGHYFALDQVGASAWQLLREPHSFAELRDLLLERYNVSAEELEVDLRELLSGLITSGLVLVKEE